MDSMQGFAVNVTMNIQPSFVKFLVVDLNLFHVVTNLLVLALGSVDGCDPWV